MCRVKGNDGFEVVVLTEVLEEAEGNKLRQLTMSDTSLKKMRQWAEEKANGYYFLNGLLMHEKCDEWEGTLNRIVVPMLYREQIMDLVHQHSGHLGVQKMRKLLNRYCTWTGMHVDLCKRYAYCEACQKVAKNMPKSAPLQPVCIISEPFERVAFDIVGPLTRSKQGYKYILTTICFASRYPDAIPLRNISAETVVDGILEVWSRTGVPREVLTDQGSQFTSKLMAQLCNKLMVKQVRMSPYHPQSNGALERFHGTLVPMVKDVYVRQLVLAAAAKVLPVRSAGHATQVVRFYTL